MAIELKMPALSPTMEKGMLAKWLVSVGDAVKPGDPLAEIETDKATMEFEAVDGGVITELLITEGADEVAVGTVIALMHESGEKLVAARNNVTAPVEAESASIIHVRAEPHSVPEAAPSRTRTSPADRVKVSPLAQRIADVAGIDLDTVTGSGPNGRIVRADLGQKSTVVPAAVPPKPLVPAVVALPPAGVPVETVKLSSMRKTIARRLSESKQTVPHFYLTARCNLDPLLALRADLNTNLDSRGIKLSVNDLIIKAVALALVAVPDANVQFGGDALHRFSRVDISMAVAIDGGLVTPVIRAVDTSSLSAIAAQSKAFAAKARDGRLVPEDYSGGTASISNLGMFGIHEMFPVINPPQALIVGVGAGVEQPWKVDGAVGLATVVALTASFDHRAIDGAVAAQFMQALKDYVETPLLLMC